MNKELNVARVLKQPSHILEENDFCAMTNASSHSKPQPTMSTTIQ